MKTYIKLDDPNFGMGNYAYYRVSHYDQNNKFTHYTWQEIESWLYGSTYSNLMELDEIDKFNICDNEKHDFDPDNFIDDCL